jgi:hypothetical protein
MTEFAQQYEQQQINELHDKMFGPHAVAAAGVVDLCSVWHMVAPYWSVIVKAAAAIPIVGGAIAAVLSAFAVAMNACCPAAQPAAAGAGAIQVSQHEQDQIHAAHAALFGATAAGEKPCCNIWKKVKLYWPIIVTVVGKIPVIGTKIADILKKLGESLDKFCG